MDSCRTVVSLVLLLGLTAGLEVRRQSFELEDERATLRPSEDFDSEVDMCTVSLEALGGQRDVALCTVVVGFERLWDTFEAEKMQEAVDKFCRKGTDIQWALTNTSFYDMYGTNVQKRVKQFGGKLTGNFSGHFEPVEWAPTKVALERSGAKLNLHLPKRRFQKVLRNSPEGFPESHVSSFQSECEDCEAMMRLLVEKPDADSDKPWEISSIQVIKLS